MGCWSISASRVASKEKDLSRLVFKIMPLLIGVTILFKNEMINLHRSDKRSLEATLEAEILQQPKKEQKNKKKYFHPGRDLNSGPLDC